MSERFWRVDVRCFTTYKVLPVAEIETKDITCTTRSFIVKAENDVDAFAVAKIKAWATIPIGPRLLAVDPKSAATIDLPYEIAVSKESS